MDDMLAYVGVDWASATDYAYALDGAGQKRGHRSERGPASPSTRLHEA